MCQAIKQADRFLLLNSDGAHPTPQEVGVLCVL